MQEVSLRVDVCLTLEALPSGFGGLIFSCFYLVFVASGVYRSGIGKKKLMTAEWRRALCTKERQERDREEELETLG
jgi:hypothetical protein